MKTNLLAINTAFMQANLALETADGQKFLRDLDANCKHSENVLETIDQICQEANMRIDNVDVVAIILGPGSFTGLRIGASIGKALGCVNERLKFLSLSSLEFMAYTVCKRKLTDENFVCALNALSNQYFVAYFDSKGIKLEDERMIDKQEFDKIKEKKFVLVGDLLDEEFCEISLSSVDLIEFARTVEESKNYVKREELLPRYIRLSQAEDNLLKKRKKD